MIDKLLLHLRRNGPRATLRRIAQRVIAGVVLSEAHRWFMLDLEQERPRPASELEVELRRLRSTAQGSAPDAGALLEQLPLPRRVSIGRLQAGHELWLALQGDRMLFSAWVFYGLTPAIAAAGGQLHLPDGVACLEDVEVAAEARGKGIAPAAYAALADTLASEGRRWVITKLEADNRSAAIAVEKAGFRPVALMRFKRRGPRTSTRLQALAGPQGARFVERVEPGLHGRRAAS